MSVNTSKVKTPIKTKNINERISNFDEIVLGYSKEEALNEAARCLNCKNPTCITGCPASNNIPLFIKYIKEDDLESAYKTLRLTSNMPDICSRVCDQSKQCEGQCIRSKSGEAVAIGMLERYVLDNYSKNVAEPQYFSQKVAIIGSGPAGLSCAEELNSLGYGVTVFERKDRYGGLLTYGIPNYRLPYHFVEKKIEELKCRGIEFKNNCSFGKDFSFNSLKNEGYSAIFVAVGAGKAKYMHIPGEDLVNFLTSEEVLENISSLSKWNFSSKKPILYGKIAVVGGGNSAIDVARSAIRLNGVKSVDIIYRRTEEDMPAAVYEVEEAIAEGVKLNTLTNPIEILGDENRVVSGLRCVKMYQTEVGSDGRKGVKPILNSEFDRSFDFVIYAIGNDCESYLSGLDEIEVTKWNSIIVNKGGQTTKNPYIFAAGDVVTGPATVVQAMSDGKKTAHKIDEFLKNI